MGLCTEQSHPAAVSWAQVRAEEKGTSVKEYVDPKHLEIFSHRLQDSYEN